MAGKLRSWIRGNYGMVHASKRQNLLSVRVNAVKLWVTAIDAGMWDQVLNFNQDQANILKEFQRSTGVFRTVLTTVQDGHYKGGGGGSAIACI